ncbi:MFS transporter [Nonomuraea sp. NPDC050663]|uniref:MFS transporter n=1 Tax=Nonomuraea sp. NPDC050663 TaxID=3364370 RepID=UPI003795A913
MPLLLDVRPLAVPAYRRLWTGQVTAGIGLQASVVAVGQQIWELTRESLWVGMLGVAHLLPLVVFGLWGGAIADAMDRRKLLIIGSSVAWVSTLGILIQALLGIGSVWLLLANVAVGAAGFAVSSPTRGAIIPRVLPKELVTSANALNGMVMGTASLVGPMVAGVLMWAAGGYAAVYAFDAVLFTATLYAAYRLPSLPPLGEVSRPGARAVAEGLRYIFTSKILLMSFVVDLCAMILAYPRALFPELVDTRFGGSEVALGLLNSAMAFGVVGGGLLSGWARNVRRQGLGLIVVIAIWGLAVAAAGLVDQLWLVVVFMAIGGYADMISSVWRQTILQTYAPDEMRGRMQGVFMVVVAGGPRLGDLRAGASAAAFGLTGAWVGGGLACVAAVIAIGLTVPSFRKYRPQL